jgi:hypothetical protein
VCTKRDLCVRGVLVGLALCGQKFVCVWEIGMPRQMKTSPLKQIMSANSNYASPLVDRHRARDLK